MSKLRRQRHDLESSVPSSPQITSPPLPAPATSLSWPEAFLTAIIVVAGFASHVFLVSHGTTPGEAVKSLMAIAIPLVALVLPNAVLGALARGLRRALIASVGAGTR